MSGLGPQLLGVVDELNAMIDSKDSTVHTKDVCRAIKDCILNSHPITVELQEQYIAILANRNTQDRYGK